MSEMTPRRAAPEQAHPGRKNRIARIWLGVVVPLAMAVLILAAGTWTPGWLLGRRAQGYTSLSRSVSVNDVRPYGDAYETMKTKLLQVIRVNQNAAYGQGSVPADSQAQENLVTFLYAWNDALNAQGYGLDALSGGMELMPGQQLTDPEGSGTWVLLQEGVDAYSGMYSSFCADPDSGAPIQISIDVVQDGGVEPQALWEGLKTAYQTQCGLQFTDLMEQEDTMLDINTSASDAESFWTDVEQVGMAQMSFTAVSTDLAFRLRLDVYGYVGNEWLLVGQLMENN